LLSQQIQFGATCPHSYSIQTNAGRSLHQMEMFDVGYDAKYYYFTDLVDAYHKLQHQTKRHLRTQPFFFSSNPEEEFSFKKIRIFLEILHSLKIKLNYNI